jgi:ribose 5-phosphate isomerase B
MKIAIGSDHRGHEAKQRIKALLLGLGVKLEDHGGQSGETCDYPDIALGVAHDVAEGRADRGILLCGSGIGMSITANKVPGIRAALCHDDLTAQMSRRHNDANVLCLPADLVGDALMQSIVKVWLQTEFEGGRHQRRVDKIVAYERGRERPDGAAAEGPAGEAPASGVAQSNSGPIGCRPT